MNKKQIIIATPLILALLMYSCKEDTIPRDTCVDLEQVITAEVCAQTNEDSPCFYKIFTECTLNAQNICSTSETSIERCSNLEDEPSFCNSYIAQSCSLDKDKICRDEITVSLSTCAITSNIGDFCQDYLENECRLRGPSFCAEEYTISLEQCATIDSAEPFCQDYLENECRLRGPFLCVEEYTISLDTCNTPDSLITHEICRSHIEEQCAEYVANNCPMRDLNACANQQLYHPLCSQLLETECIGWADEYCNPTLNVDICTSNTSLYETLSNYNPSCTQTIIDRCTGHIESFIQSEMNDPASCRGLVINDSEEASPIEREDAYSTPNTFDCETISLGSPVGAAAQWELDGERVSSCEEYAYQYFYTFNKFKNAIQPFDNNARSIHTLAYSAQQEHADFAIGHRALNNETPFLQINPLLPSQGSAAFNMLIYEEDNLSWQSFEPSNIGIETDTQYSDEFSTKSPRNELLFIEQISYPELKESIRNYHLQAAEISNTERTQYSQMWSYINTNLRTGHSLLNYWSREDLGWRWHLETSNQLSRADNHLNRPVLDTELSHFYRRRQSFRAIMESLVREREDCVYQLDTQEGTINYQEAYLFCGQRVVQENASSIASLAKTFYEFWINGCFEHYPNDDPSLNPYPTPCDWAPEDFVEDFQRTLSSAEQTLTNNCRSQLRHSFEDIRDGYDYFRVANNQVVRRDSSVDGSSTMDNFNTYLLRQQETVKQLPRYLTELALTGPERIPTLGQTQTYEDEFGSRDYIAVGYQAGFSWGLLHEDVDEFKFSAISPRAEIYLNTYAFLFSDPVSIGEVHVNYSQQSSTLNGNIKVFGYNTWSDSADITSLTLPTDVNPLSNLDLPGEPQLNWNVVFDENVNKSAMDERRFDVGQFISIGGLSIILEIGGAGQLGVDLNLRAWSASNDSTDDGYLHAGIYGTINPYADIKGFAQLGVNIGGLLEAGIGGSLDLIDIKIPSSLLLYSKSESGPTELSTQFTVKIKSNLILKALKSEIYTFIRSGFIPGSSKKFTIFKHPGITRENSVIDSEFNENARVVFDSCSTDLISCPFEGRRIQEQLRTLLDP